MSELKRISGIDIDEDMDYQWREWRVHRIAWAVFALLLVATLLGLFGQGPLSRATVGEPGSSLVLDYEQIDRYQAPTSVDFTLGPNVAQDGEVRLSVNHEFLERIEIERVIPEPKSVETGPKSVTYVFNVAAQDQPSRIRFEYQYDTAGLARAEVQLAGGTALQFSSFVFP